MIMLSELPYKRDSAELFTAVANQPWSIFLDSGYPCIDLGRYDIIACEPFITIESFARESRVTTQTDEIISYDDPFELLQSYLGKPESNVTGLPFCGGAIGYFSYDLGRRIESLPEIAEHDIALPDMAVGIYDWAVVIDHHQRQSWLTGFGRDAMTEEKWRMLQDKFSAELPKHDGVFEIKSGMQANMSQTEYGRAFDRVRQYIEAGDCYQVNLAQRFSFDVSGNSWDAYARIRKLNPAPFSAYMNIPQGAVLSASPEQFLQSRNRLVQTKPIKGTRPRSAFAYEDKALAVSLLESKKDRAENLMIVDLLRNDISKNCEFGSVNVPSLFALESHASVHHLVSTVTGYLQRDRHVLELLRGGFPGGSITGAPKLRAMQIIEELEPHRRSVYAGALGYIGFDGNMDTNITIRTLVRYRDKIYCWAGGGLVSDSCPEAEYKECFDKVSAILKFFDEGAISRNVGN